VPFAARWRLGASKDPRKAYFWWLLAAENGLSSATKDIERIEREFSEFERRSIQAEESQWWDARFE
jgi:TPR repeat protein